MSSKAWTEKCEKMHWLLFVRLLWDSCFHSDTICSTTVSGARICTLVTDVTDSAGASVWLPSWACWLRPKRCQGGECCRGQTMDTLLQYLVNLQHSYWTCLTCPIDSWFALLRDGDFPVPKLLVYQTHIGGPIHVFFVGWPSVVFDHHCPGDIGILGIQLAWHSTFENLHQNTYPWTCMWKLGVPWSIS